MAVGFNAVTVAQAQATGITLAHNPQGGNRLLLFSVAWVSDSGEQLGWDIPPAFGGVPMVQVGLAQIASDTSREVWRTIAPPLGAANITASWPETVEFVAAAVSYTGVDQTTPLGAPVTSFGNGTGASLVVAGTADGSMVADSLAMSLGSTNASATVHGAQTVRQNAQQGPSLFRLRMAASDDLGGGDVGMAWTIAPGVPWVQQGVEIKPAAATGRVSGRSGLSSIRRLGRPGFGP